MPTHPLKHLEPSNKDLLRLVYQHVDNSMLREIAEADYGQEADKHLSAIKTIKAGDIPAPMQWEPKEVLELIRWSQPEDPHWSPGSTGARGHWMRLFACALLMRSAAEPESEGYFLGEDSTVINLVDSAKKLGTDVELAALKFLCWRIQYRQPIDCYFPYFAIATLILALSLNKYNSATEDFLITPATSDVYDVPEMFADSMSYQTWKNLIRTVLIESNNSNDKLRALGGFLIGTSDSA